jgi:hypothetical protein
MGTGRNAQLRGAAAPAQQPAMSVIGYFCFREVRHQSGRRTKGFRPFMA